MHKLSFCEPATESIEDDEFYFEVNNDMYQKILSKPIALGEDNGYLFGLLFDKKAYQWIGGHGCDVCQTAIIDLSFNKKKWDTFHDYHCDIASDYDYEYDEEIINKLRIKYPEILWIDSTLGCSGANYYAHYDENKYINSIIIDFSYF